jgi:hypothetical protein
MPSNQTQNASAAPGGIDRRKHSRHRFIVDLNISSESGATMHGMSFEIGAGGMSAVTAGQLEVGEQVLVPSSTGANKGYRSTEKRVYVWI